MARHDKTVARQDNVASLLFLEMRDDDVPVGAVRKLLFVPGVLAALALAGCGRSHGPPAPLQAVTVAKVEPSSAREEARFSGHVEPASQVDVSFKVGGYVERVATATAGKPRLLQEGDDVTRGQELASLRRTDYEQQLAVATASREQAEASRRQAELDVARSRTLASSGAIAPAQLDADGNRLAGAVAASSEAAARLSQNALALRDTSLRSPLNGTIVQRTVEVGTLAAPSMVAFTVADLSVVKVVFAIPDVRLPSIHLGAQHVVTVDALPGVEWKGTVTRISPVADPRSHVFEIHLEIPNPERRLKPGMVAALLLPLDGAAAATQARVLVPLSSIVRAKNGSGFAVFVVENKGGENIVHATDVALGEYMGRAISVEHGLSANETVVVQGAGLLSDGTRVAVLP